MLKTKDTTYTFRLTSEEKEQIFDRAEKLNIKPSEYILNKIFQDETLERIKKMKTMLCEMSCDYRNTVNPMNSMKIKEYLKAIDFILDNLEHVDDGKFTI